MEVIEAATFGEALRTAREHAGLTLRELAGAIGVSAPYLSDLEKDRRNAPPLDRLRRLTELLHLSGAAEEHFLDLAGTSRGAVAPDVTEYVMQRGYVSAALRTARDLGAGEEEWQRMVELLVQNRGQKPG